MQENEQKLNAGRLSANTWKQYRSVCRRLKQVLGHVPLERLDYDSLRGYVNDLSATMKSNHERDWYLHNTDEEERIAMF